MEKIKTHSVIQWVSVDKNLPQKNTFVLAYYPQGNENGKSIDTTTYYGGDKLTDTGSSVAYFFEASHWAKLPDWNFDGSYDGYSSEPHIDGEKGTCLN